MDMQEILASQKKKIVTKAPSHLIVWRENNRIIGHAIWHETNTEEHREGEPRDKEDREILEKLLGGKSIEERVMGRSSLISLKNLLGVKAMTQLYTMQTILLPFPYVVNAGTKKTI